jgi:hypothetical protein
MFRLRRYFLSNITSFRRFRLKLKYQLTPGVFHSRVFKPLMRLMQDGWTMMLTMPDITIDRISPSSIRFNATGNRLTLRTTAARAPTEFTIFGDIAKRISLVPPPEDVVVYVNGINDESNGPAPLRPSSIEIA